MDNSELEQEITKKITNLPTKDKHKVVALKFYLDQLRNLDENLDEQCDKLQARYDQMSIPLFTQADSIILGQKEISQDDLVLSGQLLDEEEQQQLKDFDLATIKQSIPDYWLQVFKNGNLDELALTEKDQEAFKFLQRVEFHLDDNLSDFDLKFYFAEENPFFTNEFLQKRFIFDDDEVVKAEGCKIEWKDGKNLTKKLTKKKQRNKKTGQTRVISKEVEDESFFHFFRSLDVSNKEKFEKLTDDEQQNIQEQLDVDYNVSRIIVDELLPYSLEYFLGMKKFGDKESDISDDETDKEEDEDEEEEEEVNIKKKKKQKSKSKSKGKN